MQNNQENIMTIQKRFSQAVRITISMLILSFFMMGNFNIAQAGTNGITPTPTPETPPINTPVPTEVVNTPVPVQPTATPQPAQPTNTPVSSGSSNPTPVPPTPTPSFPTEIPELGYGPSIWMSLSILFALTLLLGAVATYVIRRITA